MVSTGCMAVCSTVPAIDPAIMCCEYTAYTGSVIRASRVGLAGRCCNRLRSERVSAGLKGHSPQPPYSRRGYTKEDVKQHSVLHAVHMWYPASHTHPEGIKGGA